MQFLPVRIDGQKVYAGFWRRFCSAWVDVAILIPVTIFYVWLAGLDKTLAIFIAVPYFILSTLYFVFFNVRFGGTPGKLALGIRITKPDGSRIGWKEAWKRSAVDIPFSLIILILQVWALILIDPEVYASKDWLQKGTIVLDFFPDSHHTVQVFQNIWFWSEFVVLLLNERKRALHDFIAETVVIKKEFIKTA
jgi:uncharacterized RDD family membrane protein YckC